MHYFYRTAIFENSFCSSTIEECESVIQVGGAPSIGGLIGYSSNSNISTTYFAGTKAFSSYNSGLISGLGRINAKQCFSALDQVDIPLFKSASGTFISCYAVCSDGKEFQNPNQGKAVSRDLLSMQSWYAQNMPDWDFNNIWYMPTNENALPRHSIEPIIECSGDMVYGNTITLTSNNTNKGLLIESADPSSIEIDNNSVILKRAGNIDLTITQEAYGEYRKLSKKLTLNVAKRMLTVSVSDSKSAYGDEIPKFVVIYEGFIFKDDALALNESPTVLCDATSTHNIGTYPIIIQGGKADNYTLKYQNGRHTIIPRKLLAKPRDCSRKYGIDNPNFYIDYDGFINGDNENIVITPPTAHTTANKQSDTGSYNILCKEGQVSPNYTLEYGTGILTIEKTNLYIGVRDEKRAKGEFNPKFVLTYNGFKNNNTELDLDELPIAYCEANPYSEPGIYPIILSGGHDKNYEYSLQNGNLIIMDDSGVSITETDTTEAVYYTLQGSIIKSSELKPGIYIKLYKGKATKVLIY